MHVKCCRWQSLSASPPWHMVASSLHLPQRMRAACHGSETSGNAVNSQAPAGHLMEADMRVTCDGHGPGMMGSNPGLLRLRLRLSEADASGPGLMKGLARTFSDDKAGLPSFMGSGCDEPPPQDSLFEVMLPGWDTEPLGVLCMPPRSPAGVPSVKAWRSFSCFACLSYFNMGTRAGVRPTREIVTPRHIVIDKHLQSSQQLTLPESRSYLGEAGAQREASASPSSPCLPYLLGTDLLQVPTSHTQARPPPCV